MEGSYIAHDKFDQLRWRVEEVLKKWHEENDAPPGSDLPRLIHELEAHQVELELQNEELRAVRNDLQESRNRYADLYQNAPVGYLDLTRDGLINMANIAARKMLGISEIPSNLAFSSFIHAEDRGKFWVLMRRAARRGAKAEEGIETCTLRIVGEGRKEAFIQLEISPELDEDRKVKGWRLVGTDLTERMQDEQKLLETKVRLRGELKAMVRLQRIGSMFATTAGALEPVLREIIKAAAAICGADFGAIQLADSKTGMFQVAVQQGLPEWWTASWNGVCKGRGGCCAVLRRRKRTVILDVVENPMLAGTPAREVMLKAGVKTVQCTPLRSWSGTLVGVFSTHYREQKRLDARTLGLLDMFGRYAADIIERAQMVEELRRSEERLRALVLASSDAIYQISPDWKEIRRIYGVDAIRDAESSGGYWLMSCVYSEDRAPMLAKINESIRDKSIFEHEYRYISEGGGVGWRFSRAVPILDANGEIVEWFGAATDITERKGAEDARGESEERFRALVQASSDVIYQMSPDWKEVVRVFGREDFSGTENMYGDWLPKYIPSEDQPGMLAKIGDSIRNESIFEYEHRVLRPDGSLSWIFSRAIPVKNDEGKIVGWFGASSDVTQRKQAEEALRESEERFRVAQELSPDGFTILRPVRDEAGRVVDFTWVYQNPAMGRMTGSDLNDVAGRRLLDVFPNVCSSPFFEAYRHVAETGETLVIEDLYGGAYLRQPTWLRVAVVRMGRDIAILAQDITERKQMEEELRRSREELEKRVRERTASLKAANKKLRRVPSKLIEVQENESKRLASDLHDSVGQTLAALKFHIEHIASHVRGGKAQEAERMLEEFIPIIQRSIEETRTIYMGLKPTVLTDRGLLAALEWYRHQLLAVYKNIHIELETQIREEDIPEAFKVAMFRIAQEALNNACKHSGAEWIDVRVGLSNDHVELEIGDDGRGMDVGYVLKSSTAKSLGLMGMKERAEISGGKLRIESTLNEGVRVRAIWPVAKKVVRTR